MSARTIVVAGAGIGGLAAALALAQKGFRVALLDKAARLEETGAGIQLSPNAARVLIGLGLRERLLPSVVAPEAVVIRTAQGTALARLPLGAAAEARYGAPYWMIHRGDLQAALLAAARAHPEISLALGAAVDDCAVHANGVTVQVLGSQVEKSALQSPPDAVVQETAVQEVGLPLGAFVTARHLTALKSHQTSSAFGATTTPPPPPPPQQPPPAEPMVPSRSATVRML